MNFARAHRLLRGVVLPRRAVPVRLGGLLLLSGLLLFPACTEQDPTPTPPAERPPNLVVVVLDTLRADHLGLYGYPGPTSPLLDRRAAEFTVFDGAQTVAPWTCPSLISLMTSLYPQVHQVRSFPAPERLGDGVQTLAELLRERGYRTAAFTEGGYAKALFGLGQGFEEYPENPGDEQSNTSNLDRPSQLHGNLTRTMHWIEDHQAEPFFAFFHTYEPHAPFRAPQDEVRDFRPDFDEKAEHDRLRQAIETWNTTGEMAEQDRLLLEIHQFHCSLQGLPEVERRLDPDRESPRQAALEQALIELYDAEIRFTDRELERLFLFLEQQGLDENTVVVVVSDHGEGLGEHGRYGHGKVLAEEVLRVVLMIRAAKGGPPPGRVPEVVSSVDVMPTVLDLLGVPAEELPKVQGRSLVPAMRGETASVPAYSHALGVARERDLAHTVRTQDWRLVAYRDGRLRFLYDRAADPGELRDVSAEHPEVVAQMLELLRQQQERDRALRQLLDAPPEQPVMDQSLQDELRRLGYLDERSR